MVRNYIRKTTRGNWDESQMKSAIECVQKKEMSIRKAAVVFAVPKDSLQRRIKGALKSISSDKPYQKFLSPRRNVLSEEQEKELADYIREMDMSFYGLSINEIRRVVFDYVEKNKIKHPFNKEKKMAGRDFVNSFLKRQKTLSLRKPEGVALNRVFGLNKKSVEQYFSNLKELLDTHHFEPHQIYNCDETGLTCVHKPVKVIAPKGKRVVASVTSGERGQTTTIINAMNATGTFVPPMMIFKRKRMNTDLIQHAPPGTIGGCSDSGWVDTDLFMTYIKHFCKHTKCSKDSKILLILDGHKSHTKNMELINYARENGLFLLSLAPHTSHKLQPLDRSFFKTLKCAFNVACSSWLRKHPARRITVDKLGELFSEAYLKSATVQNAVSGFRATGIYPLNRNVIPDSEFLDDPREAVPMDSAAGKSNEVPPSLQVEKPKDLLVNDPPTPNKSPELSASFQREFLTEPVAGPSNTAVASLQTEETMPTDSLSSDTSLDASSFFQKMPAFEISTQSEVSFSEIMPVPKILAKKSKKRGEESEIITSSPYKKRLETLQKGKKSKEENKSRKQKASKKVKAKKSKKLKKSGPAVEAKGDEGQNDDVKCLICESWWHESLPGDDWIKCSSCSEWFHEDCCTSFPTAEFRCDMCL